jgi:hypothetical protein
VVFPASMWAMNPMFRVLVSRFSPAIACPFCMPVEMYPGHIKGIFEKCQPFRSGGWKVERGLSKRPKHTKAFSQGRSGS